MNDLEVIINIKLMNSNQLTPNYYVMLHYIFYDIPHRIGPMTKAALIKLRFLDSKGNLTDKARNLFKEDDLKQLNDKKMKEFLLELREYFPKGVTTGGSPVRTAIGIATVKKMKKFINEYGYSKDIIIKATKSYVADRKKNNYGYMKKFTNFIDKQGEGSLLATFCETIENGEERSTTNTRIERTL
jgi:hypothetical protein